MRVDQRFEKSFAPKVSVHLDGVDAVDIASWDAVETAGARMIHLEKVAAAASALHVLETALAE